MYKFMVPCKTNGAYSMKEALKNAAVRLQGLSKKHRTPHFPARIPTTPACSSPYTGSP